ncbi:MAG: ATP-dependent helicase/nuclease subunit [Actinomycetota bacterium]|nr:ATP-dependent helicase/nuclease subunit [Actinomycetota bacterium]
MTRVAYGEAAVAALAEQVRALRGAGDPLAPVTVVVPSNYAAVATRRELARRGGVVAVAFSTLYRLAERLAGPVLAALGRRPVSAPIVLQAVRAVLASEPGVLAPVAGHAATELALAAACRELAGVDEVGLSALAAQSDRAADVVRIVRLVGERLRASWYDEHDLVAAATTAVTADVGPVIVYLPERLPPGGGELLRALARHTPVSVLVGATGVDDADGPVVAGLERAGIPVGAASAIDRPMATRVVSASDPDEEVRAVVRMIVCAAREGVSFGRMAVFFGAADPYARLLREQLDAAGIAANGTPVRAIGDMVAGRVLRSLLALPDRRFRRSDVLAALSTADVPVREWERVSRAAGVVEGTDWTDKLAAFAEERMRRAGSADADERPRLASRFRHEAARAESLSGYVADLVATIAAGDDCSTWRDMSSWAAALLSRYLPAHATTRKLWPDAEREAAERVEAAVERLGGLDAVDGPTPTVEVFRRLLDGELDAAVQRIGRLGEGVLVGPLSLAAGLTLDRVFVVGLAEGTFPDRRLDDSLLPDRERAVAGGQLTLRADHIHDDHRHLLAALAAGPATVCFPRGDLRQPGSRTASRWLLDDASRLDGGPSRLFTADLHAREGAGWLDVVPSFTAGLRRAALPATTQEHRLAVLLRGDGPLSSRTPALVDPVLAAGAALAEARRSNAFTRFDGNLDGVDLGPITDGRRAHSATRLQAWAECPHAYLLEHVLGVEPLEEPERRLRLDPLDKGALVHEVLHRFVAEGSRDLDRLLAIGAEVCDEFASRGRTGRQLFWRRDRARILADLEVWFADDESWRKGVGAEPVAAEHRFDTVVPLPAGEGVRVRGVIDRIDRLPDGRLVVFDYKTGRSEPYKGLGEDDPHQGGARLQPVLYAAGAGAEFGGEPVRFDYWFVTSAGGFDRIGYEVTPAVADDVGGALATIVDGIEQGLFPRRPPESPAWNRVDCWYCSPDGLNAAEARRDWERKRADAVLAGYVSLCEPTEDDDGDA